MKNAAARRGEVLIKTLILNGSPRPNGDTASLLRLLKENLSGEYRQIDAYQADISPCVDCRFCWTRGGCAIQDEMQAVYSYIRTCDNIVIASPIYFSELTGKLLDVGSRLQTYYCARHFRQERPLTKAKKGAILLVGGGDGAPDRAEGTARMLLRSMNCRDIHPMVCSHDTNHRPAIEDEAARAGVESVAAFFSREG